jgi:hypothetical protein
MKFPSSQPTGDETSIPAALNPDFAGPVPMPSVSVARKSCCGCIVEVLAGISRVIFWLHSRVGPDNPAAIGSHVAVTLRLTVRTRVSLRAATMLHPSEQTASIAGPSLRSSLATFVSSTIIDSESRLAPRDLCSVSDVDVARSATSAQMT